MRALRAFLRNPVWIFYAVATALLLAFAVTLFVRHAGQTWAFVDNQGVDGLEVMLALACLTRAASRRPGRGPALALGLGLLCWAVGDVIWSTDPVSSVSIADAFYLAFYPLACVALVLLTRSHVARIRANVWLDGLVAGLGAAAVLAAFAFDTILSSINGSSLTVAVNLAYPIGDLALLALAIGALVLVPGTPARLLVFAAGCTLMAVGDTVYLFQSSAGSYQVGTPVNLTWPLAILAMSVSVWIGMGNRVRSVTVERAPRLVIPAVAAVACVVILMLGNVGHVSAVALGMAAATLVAAAVRLVFSLRELRGMTEARRHEAATDELTGLANRRQMLDELARAFHALRSGDVQCVALLLIDLDHFKEVNDSFGHQTGDALLKQIGPRISAVTRPTDLVARLGGDEFAVILTGADARFATSVAQRITDALAEPIVVESAALHVGGSIGVAVAPLHARSADELIRCADVAMYRAKGAKSDFDIYEAALDDGPDKFRLIEDLRQALDDGSSLTLHYQPEVDLRTGRVVTVEALLRWPHPTLGMIPPEHLLNLAEEGGMIRPLTDWVFRRALRRLRPLVERGAPGLGGGEPVGHRPARRLAAGTRGEPAGAGRPAPRGSRARDHRAHDHGRPRASQARHRRPGRPRRAGLDRRLRHRVLLPGPPERAGRRRTEARPHVHGPSAGRRAGRAGRVHRPVGHRPRPRRRPLGGGGGHRADRVHGPARRARLRHRARVRHPGAPRR